MRGARSPAFATVEWWERIIIPDCLLKCKYDDILSIKLWQQLVIPHTLREEIMPQLYAGALEGHLGVDKIMVKIKERYYGPGMHEDVNQWIHTCSCCTIKKSPSKHNRGPLQTIKAVYPLQVVTVDILGHMGFSISKL